MLTNLMVAAIIEGYLEQLEENDAIISPQVLDDFLVNWSEYDEKGTGFISPLNYAFFMYGLMAPLGLKDETQSQIKSHKKEEKLISPNKKISITKKQYFQFLKDYNIPLYDANNVHYKDIVERVCIKVLQKKYLYLAKSLEIDKDMSITLFKEWSYQFPNLIGQYKTKRDLTALDYVAIQKILFYIQKKQEKMQAKKLLIKNQKLILNPQDQSNNIPIFTKQVFLKQHENILRKQKSLIQINNDNDNLKNYQKAQLEIKKKPNDYFFVFDDNQDEFPQDIQIQELNINPIKKEQLDRFKKNLDQEISIQYDNSVIIPINKENESQEDEQFNGDYSSSNSSLDIKEQQPITVIQQVRKNNFFQKTQIDPPKINNQISTKSDYSICLENSQNLEQMSDQMKFNNLDDINNEHSISINQQQDPNDSKEHDLDSQIIENDSSIYFKQMKFQKRTDLSQDNQNMTNNEEIIDIPLENLQNSEIQSNNILNNLMQLPSNKCQDEDLHKY